MFIMESNKMMMANRHDGSLWKFQIGQPAESEPGCFQKNLNIQQLMLSVEDQVGDLKELT